MRRRRHLGAAVEVHAASAKKAIDDAWLDLERMPPTCRGAITLAARALGNAERGLAHAWSIEDRQERESRSGLFASGNHAVKAAWETIQFLSATCDAPHRQAAERPLFSRASGKYKKEKR